jgi:uncharacterized protein YbjT (DUF2867 family)
VNAAIFGATGMVGAEVLHTCLESPQIDRVVAIGRQPTGVVRSKLVEIEHQDFLDFSPLDAELSQIDISFYCLGVYQNQVPADAFWKITVDYLGALMGVLERVNRELTFCLFSAQGADQTEKSPFRFAKAKGLAEKILSESGIPQKYIFRPGYINPGRKTAQAGWAEWAARQAYKVMPQIGIDAADLSKVMVDIGLNGHENRILSNREMRNLAQKFN